MIAYTYYILIVILSFYSIHINAWFLQQLRPCIYLHIINNAQCYKLILMRLTTKVHNQAYNVTGKDSTSAPA